MVDIKSLLPELKKLVTDLAEDLLARCTENAEIDTGLLEAYTQIEKARHRKPVLLIDALFKERDTLLGTIN